MSITKKTGTIIVALSLFTLTSFAQENKKTTGYQGIVELGGAKFVKYERAPFLGTVDFINGYKFNPLFSMGIGVGILFSTKDIGAKDSYIVPLYVNFRVNFDSGHKVFPYIQTKLGIAFASGIQLAIMHHSFGICFKESPISIGLSGEMLDIHGMHVNSIGLNIGFSF